MDALSISAGSSHSSYAATATVEVPKVRVQAASDAGSTTNAEQSANALTGSGAAPPTQDSLQKAIDKANKVLETKTSNELRFAMDKETGLQVVKMINQDSGKTVLQFPSEAMLAIAKSIDQMMGTILSRKA